MFLPEVKVTTIIWGGRGREYLPDWYAAQGDDLKLQRAAIEINLEKVAQDKGGDIPQIATAMVNSWLNIYIVLATRQDLINKMVRGSFSPEGEGILEEANFKAIKASPVVWRQYAEIAASQLKAAQVYAYPAEEKTLLDKVFEEMDKVIKPDLSIKMKEKA